MALLSAGGVSFALLFVAVALFDRPGLGIGRFLFLPVVLLALATDAWIGALGGVLATALYVIAVIRSPHMAQSSIFTLSTLVRFTSFVAVGALIGYFAKEHRDLVGRPRALADRDDLTGRPRLRVGDEQKARGAGSLLAPARRDRAARRSRSKSGEADALLRVSRLPTTCLDPRDSLVRVGQNEFGVLTSLSSGEKAGKLAATLESVLDQSGLDVTFGWAVAPQQGTNALSLCQAADERRYARTLIRAARPTYA
jgi:hypothetical protein